MNKIQATIGKNAPQVAIYACGGTGMNLGPAFAKIVEENPFLAGKVVIYSIDTSLANHKPFHTADNTLVIGSGKGSGKKRDTNYPEIKAAVPEILHKFQPGQFNIMLAGLSGGSGSIIQSVLLSELLGASIPAMVVGVGSIDSEREVLNLNQSYLSFNGIPGARKKPVIVNYSEIGVAGTRGAVDKRVLDNLTRLSLMFACIAEKIDTSDLSNYLNYPVISNFQPGLAAIEITSGTVSLRDREVLFGVTTLATADMPTMLDPRPPFQSAGFLTDDQAEAFGITDTLHFAIIGGSFDGLIERNKTLLAEFAQAALAYRPATHLTQDVAVEDDGNVV